MKDCDTTLKDRKRNIHIDVLKGLCILSVILLHSMSVNNRELIGGPFHILQAVPIFIIITGYNFSSGYGKVNSDNLLEFYNIKYIGKKFKRVLKPFIFIFMLEVIILFVINRVNLWQILKSFLTGGYGPGSYYIPLMIQVIILSPILYFYSKRNWKLTFIIVLIVNIIFEWFAFTIAMPNSVYRLLLLRYILALELGILLFINKIKVNKYIIITAVLSCVYIFGVHYLGVQLFTQLDWQSQNIYGVFYPFFISIIFINKKIKLNEDSIVVKLLSNFGKASYHIYLSQMIYFWVMSSAGVSLGVLGVIVNPIICIVLGIAFLYVENLVNKK